MTRRIKNRIRTGFLKGTATAAFLLILIGMAAVDYTPMHKVIPMIIVPMLWLGLLGYAQVRR